ncbi:hypothetical protein J437_LFUL006312 [Ladona fulva]|uniref:Uncharacterized protein n=1 Tax=Ladona fulva TaxID=123851 RepID=A0A8K0K1M8_LADFU|nr:hypothetical protein J437_LFUL006312 [Ladona fulva]
MYRFKDMPIEDAISSQYKTVDFPKRSSSQELANLFTNPTRVSDSSVDFFAADQRPPAPELDSFASQFPESSGDFGPQSIPQETVFQPVAPTVPDTVPKSFVETLIRGQPWDGAEAVDFGHEEEREGMDTNGKYHVLYPNGRVLVVRYKVDGHGYQPILSYQ